MFSSMRYCICLIILYNMSSSICKPDSDHSWFYHDNGGAFEWCEKYKDCSRYHQSPINILTKDVTAKYFGKFETRNFEEEAKSVETKVNGHKAYLDMKWNNTPNISGGGLNGTYYLKDVHFHWGSKYGGGAEHTFDGERSTMEMHLVFYKYGYEEDEISEYKDSIAVFAVLIEEDNNKSRFIPLPMKPQKELETNKITEDKRTISIANLLPENIASFYRYHGSLTTPPCYEVVTWTLFNQHVYITSEQMKLFYSLKSENNSLGNNYRPTQARHNRVVYYTAGKTSTLFHFHLKLMCLISTVALHNIIQIV